MCACMCVCMRVCACVCVCVCVCVRVCVCAGMYTVGYELLPFASLTRRLWLPFSPSARAAGAVRAGGPCSSRGDRGPPFWPLPPPRGAPSSLAQPAAPHQAPYGSGSCSRVEVDAWLASGWDPAPSSPLPSSAGPACWRPWALPEQLPLLVTCHLSGGSSDPHTWG